MDNHRKIELHKILGMYIPSVMKLKINIPDDLERIIGSNYESVLVHEFIHFLQDISTIYGLMNFNIYLNDLAGQAENIYKQPYGSKIKRKSVLVYESKVSVNKDLVYIYRGSNDEIKELNENIKINLISIKENHVEQAPELLTYYLNFSDEKINNIHFGAIQIMESMAYELETAIYPNAFKSDDHPYKIVRLLLERNTKLSFSSKEIVAICDAALMGFHPAEAIFHMLHELKGMSKNPDILWYYDYVIDAQKAGKTVNNEEISRDIFTKISEINMMVLNFFPPPNLENVSSWLIEKTNKLLEIRKRNFAFLPQILEGNATESRIKILELIRDIGTPLILNQNDVAYTVLGNDADQDSVFWNAIDDIKENLIGISSSCSLYNFCSMHGDEANIPNSDCLTQPWERTKLEKLCYFAKLWKFWKLGNYDFI